MHVSFYCMFFISGMLCNAVIRNKRIHSFILSGNSASGLYECAALNCSKSMFSIIVFNNWINLGNGVRHLRCVGISNHLLDANVLARQLVKKMKIDEHLEKLSARVSCIWQTLRRQYTHTIELKRCYLWLWNMKSLIYSICIWINRITMKCEEQT